MKSRLCALLMAILMGAMVGVCPALSEEQEANFVFSPTPAPLEEVLMTLSFVGDMSIGDATQAKRASHSLTNVINEKGYAWPFSLVKEYLLNDDYTFGNLEVNFTTKENLKSSKKHNMIGQPDFVNVLLEGGIDVVNTVNNHCMDFTREGYLDTLSVLDAAGVNHFGSVYPGQKKGSDILGRATVKGIEIGMVGFTYPTTSDLNRIKTRIAQLREEGCALVVVSLHWGRETHLTSLHSQYQYAKKIIDMGADVIWGHHPHVLQPIFFYQGKPIFFSTGNFIFGTMSNVNPNTGVFQLDYSVKSGRPVLKTLRVIPMRTGASGDYRPYELTDEAQRRECFTLLRGKKEITDLTMLPESFLETGLVDVSMIN